MLVITLIAIMLAMVIMMMIIITVVIMMVIIKIIENLTASLLQRIFLEFQNLPTTGTDCTTLLKETETEYTVIFNNTVAY